MLDDCVFCREIAGSRDTNFAIRYPGIDSRIIYGTYSLVAFPCIGQLTKGHFLIVPREHSCTFRQVKSRLASLAQELDQLNTAVHERLGIQMNNSLLFEHGALTPNNGGCGIYHAHLHVVPNVEHVHPNDVFNFGDVSPVHSVEAAWDRLSTKDSYVLAGNLPHGFYCRSIYSPLPSQTLRKNVAHALGDVEWDWRKTMWEADMISTLRKASVW
jgi:diadenosine tetraphosphate (Ap4A) HIT family hydrolase